MTFEGGKQEELLATSESEKQSKRAKVRNEPTQINYYDGLEETTAGDKEMEQEPEYATWSEAHGLTGIGKKLSRGTRNNKRKKRNKQRATIREQRRCNQLAAKQRLEQSKLTICRNSTKKQMKEKWTKPDKQRIREVGHQD